MDIDVIDPDKIKLFQELVIDWGKENYQEFVWRKASTPYEYLIAEIMLHRTQARQVEPVYKAFIEKFPDFDTLSRAPHQEIHDAMYSLGLHWRIEKMLVMISEINENFNGQIPVDKIDLMSLSGISDYISSAIRCFYWNEPEALIDTNTVRVVGRVYGLPITDSSRRNKTFKTLLQRLVSRKHPQKYNYGLLDLAHLRCHPKDPDCSDCPLINFPCRFAQDR